jgi:hypothetical protein
MADWKNILSDNNEQLTDEDLLKYLDSNTSEEEKYVIEKKLANASFESDAVDGLQQIKSRQRLKSHVKQLNRQLQHQLYSKKHKKQKRNIKEFEWLLFAILVLLLICIIAFGTIYHL